MQKKLIIDNNIYTVSEFVKDEVRQTKINIHIIF